jgi:hypothetical protein
MVPFRPVRGGGGRAATGPRQSGSEREGASPMVSPSADGERSTCTPTPCRCRSWHVWPSAGSRTSTVCPTGSSGWTPGQRRGPWAPLPLAPQSVRRGRAPVGDGRGRRWNGTRCRFRRSCSPRPRTTGSSSRTSCGRATTSWPCTSADGPDRLLGLGFRAARDPGRRGGGPTLPRRAGARGIAIGSRGGGRDLDDPVNDELWALLAERGTFVFLHPSGVPGPEAGRRLVHAAARRVPAETAIAIARHGVQRHAGAVTRSTCAWRTGRLPAGPARADGHGLGAQGGRPTTPLPPSAYADRLYYDTAVFNTTMLRPAGGGRRAPTT